MLLRPASPRTTLTLSDRDAQPPRQLRRNDDLKKELEKELERLGELQNLLYADRRHALLVVLQGRDASGKGNVIRRVFGACNPLGVHVSSFKAPTEEELLHDFLWRVHEVIPSRGMIGIFDRSHYEDVLVVRVRRLAPPHVWQPRFRQINDFERMLTENGVVVLKFFLHVSKKEQREQLLERLHDPTKNWKFRPGDLDDRELWSEYTRAYRDAIRKCSTPWAPWYVVPSDHRTSRDYMITKIINEKLSSLHLRYPRAEPKVLALEAELKE
jgi:PPK2 family polyphosphate:nucleotide phosphotransferase